MTAKRPTGWGDGTWAGALGPFGVRGLAIGFGFITVLAVMLAVLFSSPDERPSTLTQWARERPIDFLETAVSELAGTTIAAEYGPPYNHDAKGERILFLRPQKWLGVAHPIVAGYDYVIAPLRAIRGQPMLQADLTEYLGAPNYQKADGIEGFEKAIRNVKVGTDGSARVPAGEYENVDNVMNGLLSLAQSGGLEADLLPNGGLSLADYTKPLLFLGDGKMFEDRAARQHLPPNQWAMMDETGSYPGLPALWPYTFWYEIEPFKASKNRDILVWLVMAVLALAFVCVPLIPGLRSIPRLIPIHRLIWREHYRSARQPPASA